MTAEWRAPFLAVLLSGAVLSCATGDGVSSSPDAGDGQTTGSAAGGGGTTPGLGAGNGGTTGSGGANGQSVPGSDAAMGAGEPRDLGASDASARSEAGANPARDGGPADRTASLDGGFAPDALAPSGGADFGPGGEAPTFLVTRGDLLWRDDFAGAAIQSVYEYGRSSWKLAMGALEGVHLDGHVPAVTYRVPAERVVIQFDIRFQDAKIIGINFNHRGPPESEHLGQVDYRADGQVVLWEQSGGFGSSKPLLRQLVQKMPFPFMPGRWYTCVIEIWDSMVVLSVDGKSVVQGLMDLGNPTTKDAFALTVELGVGQFDNLRVWSAAAKR